MKLGVFRCLCLCHLFWIVPGELSADEVSNLLQLYEANINTSLSLSRSDKALLSSWTEDIQVQQVNVTTKFRLQMRTHKDHSFKRTNVDKKWSRCLDLYSDEMTKLDEQYYKDEASCLKNSNEEGKDKRQAVDQIEREIKNWRKSYKYLTHLCEIENTGDEAGAKTCLVDYIEKDNYNSTLQRLLLLKLEAMGELYIQLKTAIENLEQCLRTVLSEYLSHVRGLMQSLNRCYKGTTKE